MHILYFCIRFYYNVRIMNKILYELYIFILYSKRLKNYFRILKFIN